MDEPLGPNWLTEEGKDLFRDYFDSISEELSKKISKSESSLSNCEKRE